MTTTLVGVCAGSDPIFVGDICMIEGKITLDQVVENLNRISTTQTSNRTQTFETIKRFNAVSEITAKGSGTVPGPEAASRGSDEDGMAATLAQLAGPGQAKLNALEAARLDGYAGLAKQLKGLNISDRTTLYNAANAATQSRWLEASTSALIKGARIKRYFPVGTDLVGCEMEITIQQLIQNVQSKTDIFAGGKEITMERIKQFNGDLVTVRAVGFGAVNSNPAARPAASGVIGEVK